MAKSPPLSATIERFGLVGQNMFLLVVLSATTASDNNKTCKLFQYFPLEDNNRGVFRWVMYARDSVQQKVLCSWPLDT